MKQLIIGIVENEACFPAATGDIEGVDVTICVLGTKIISQNKLLMHLKRKILYI